MNASDGGLVTLDRGVTLIEASAGTGKTHSVTDLYVRLLMGEGLEVGEILVVTFTDAATAELRDRIRRRIRQALDALAAAGARGAVELDSLGPWLTGLDEESRARGVEGLTRALRDFDQAEISTIHGFCNRALTRHAFESGVEFDVELSTDLSPLIREVAEDFWVRRLHDVPPVFLRVLAREKLGLRRAIDLTELVVKHADFEIEPDAAATRGASLDEPVRAWDAAWSDARTTWNTQRDELVALITHAVERRDIKGYGPTRGLQVDDLPDFFATVDVFFSKDREAGADLPRESEKLLPCVVNEQLEVTSPYADPENLARRAVMRRLVEAANAIWAAAPAVFLGFQLELVEHARRECRRRKLERRLRTFDDLLHDLRDALASPDTGDALRASLRGRYRAALIDEFQDTDPVQWEIFGRVFDDAERWLYIIGDPKQAIYSFRGADIHTYLAAQKTAARKVPLDTNYRSDGALVRAVNTLFDPERLPDAFLLRDITYAEVTPHHDATRLHFEEPRAPLEIRYCLRDGADLASGRGQKGQPTGIRAPWARDRIGALLAADVAGLLTEAPRVAVDGGTTRPVAPRDVAILVRTNKQARLVQRALRAASIPSVLHGAESVFASPDAMALVQILEAILDPRDVSAVKTALSTELVGCRASDLAGIEDDEARWGPWADRFREWQARWVEDGFMRMFRAMQGDLALPERVLGWSDGERRMTDLMHLAELTHTAAASARLRPRGTLAWLLAQIEGTGDEDSRVIDAELRLESDADAVEVVTIHKAKGLQYPIVYCPFLWGGGGLQSGDAAALKVHDGDRRVLDLSPPKDPAKRPRLQVARLEALAESMRLLYVALTRAKHRCVVYWGWFNQAGGCALDLLLHGASEASAGAASRSVQERRETLAKTFKARTEEQMLSDLDAVAARSGGTIEVRERSLVNIPARKYRPAAGENPPRPRARRWTRERPLDGWWRRGSFSTLARNRRPDPDKGKEYDEHHVGDADAAGEAASAEPERVRLDSRTLPGGRQTGLFLHEVYEDLDFTAPDRIPDLVADKLAGHGLDVERLAGPVSATVAETLRVALDDGVTPPFRLADIPLCDRLVEMEFDIPVAGGLEPTGRLRPDHLADLFEAHRSEAVAASYPAQLRRLTFFPLRGFLTGFIDLVFRVGDRWYLVDYKSNDLGELVNDYGPSALREAMVEGDYYLQYHLYLLALDRWLSWRDPGYRYEDHFGGVFYLFLRGMSEAHGASRGVFFDKPKPSMVRALDELFRAPEGGAR